MKSTTKAERDAAQAKAMELIAEDVGRTTGAVLISTHPGASGPLSVRSGPAIIFEVTR
jgi:hypothetical protein